MDYSPIIDNGIALTGMLFVLSMVNERIANLVKLNWPAKWLHFDISTEYPEAAKEKRRENIILLINILCGVITAVSVQVSLVHVFQNIDNLSNIIGWNNIQSPNWGLYIIGWILTGCFISLGSKFWHDLLDTLLAVKNAKKMINEQNKKDLQRDDFAQLTDDQQEQLMRDTISANYDVWRQKYTGLTGVGIGHKLKSDENTFRRALIFHVTRKGASGATLIPAEIWYTGYSIPTDVIESGTAMAAAYYGNEGNYQDAGCSIGSGGPSTGTAGLKVYQNDTHGRQREGILSCFHVLFPGVHDTVPIERDYKSDPAAAPKLWVPGPADWGGGPIPAPKKYGDIVQGMLGYHVDGAVAWLDIEGLGFTGNISQVGTVGDICPDSDLVANSTRFKKMGARTEYSTGILIEKGLTKEIDYGSFRHTLYDLYKIEMPSDHGDSGAAVVRDRDNAILGILVATEDRYAYICSIQYYITNFAIKLKP